MADVLGSPEVRRFGQRVAVHQPAQLAVGDRVLLGVIENVGLRGVFFAAPRPPDIDRRGVLRGPEGKPIAVRVVWQRRGDLPGVGLAFDS